MILGVAAKRDLPNLVTLLTDFGLADSYVGQIKGVLYSIAPGVRAVDITHSVAPGDVLGASFVLKTSYQAFPRGTIHLVVVDPGVGSERRAIVVASPEYLFVGPDNGVFSHVYDENEFEVFEIANQAYFRDRVSYTFHGRDIFAPIAAHLSLGVDPEKLGRRLGSFVKISLAKPELDGETLRGEVVHIDSFGNLITNISKRAMQGLKGSTVIEIHGTIIEGMSKSYTDKEEGALLAIWGSSDRLEISLSRGRADQFLGVGRGEPVLARAREQNSN